MGLNSIFLQDISTKVRNQRFWTNLCLNKVGELKVCSQSFTRSVKIVQRQKVICSHVDHYSGGSSLNECLLKFLGKQFPLACIARHGESWGLLEGLILILRMLYRNADINQELEVPSLLWIKILAHTEGILVFWLRIFGLSRTRLLRLLKLFPLHWTHILNNSTSCLISLSSFLFSLSEILCVHLSACLLGTKNSCHNRDFLSFPMTYPTSDDAGHSWMINTCLLH